MPSCFVSHERPESGRKKKRSNPLLYLIPGVLSAGVEMFITVHSSSSQQICYLLMLSHSVGHLSNPLMWTDFKLDVITSTTEVMFPVPFVCILLSCLFHLHYFIVCRIRQKLSNSRSPNLGELRGVCRGKTHSILTWLHEFLSCSLSSRGNPCIDLKK